MNTPHNSILFFGMSPVIGAVDGDINSINTIQLQHSETITDLMEYIPSSSLEMESIVSASVNPLTPNIRPVSVADTEETQSSAGSVRTATKNNKKQKLLIKGSPAFSHSIPINELFTSVDSYTPFTPFDLGEAVRPLSPTVSAAPLSYPSLTNTSNTTATETAPATETILSSLSSIKSKETQKTVSQLPKSISIRRRRKQTNPLFDLDEFVESTENPILTLTNLSECTRKRPNINEFFVLTSTTLKRFIEANFNANQLKQLCRYHKLNVSGIKSALFERLSFFFKNTSFALNIQKLFRGFMARRYIQSRGVGFRNKAVCVNDSDFLSLDSLTEIPHYQFFSFQDEEGHIYGFDVRSAFTLLNQGKSGKNKKEILNPYNRKEIPIDVLNSLKSNISYSKMLKYPVEIESTPTAIELSLTPEQIFNQELVSILQTMDELGNYTNISWFSELTHIKWIQFIKQIYDIWIYRSQLEKSVRTEFFPPNGKPFSKIKIGNLIHLSFDEVKNIGLTIMKRFVQSSPNDELRKLGAMYVLGALTIVCHEAATAMPWLYECFN